MNPQSLTAQAMPTLTTAKPDRLTEDVVERKTTTIIDELSQNQDYKVLFVYRCMYTMKNSN